MRGHASFIAFLLLAGPLAAEEGSFRGIVSSATPEATAAGVAVLEAGGNAVDAAVAVSLALAVSEPAGSGLFGQTVMLIRKPGEPAFLVHGTTWSPRSIPDGVTAEKLSRGHTASTVPSTLRVLDLAQRRFGSGKVEWPALVEPATRIAEQGFVVGPFRHRSFRAYADDLRKQSTAAALYLGRDGSIPQIGDRHRNPLLAKTLERIAEAGAGDFYEGDIAREIAADMILNEGWIRLEDLERFPEPAVVPAIASTYRGYDVETLPPPFGGWVVLQALNLLELEDKQVLDEDDEERRLALLDALAIAHTTRREDPVTDYADYAKQVTGHTSKETARRLRDAGETTHFSVAGADGTAVAVTQSIDSYFGAKVAHPTLGFLYNNYMQGFQVDDPEAPYYLEEREMPLSSMSPTVVSRQGRPVLVLGSPGSARIISAVTQVTSHWIDTGQGIAAAVAAYRVHALPGGRAYVEGGEIGPVLLYGMAERGMTLVRPTYGVSDSQLDPYFGGVHAIARENGAWTGAADPRRDGTTGIAYGKRETGSE